MSSLARAVEWASKLRFGIRIRNAHSPGPLPVRVRSSWFSRETEAVNNKTAAAFFALFFAPASLASADTLYVSPPLSVAPGHPISMGRDHRATQVGDIVNVVFNFSSSNSQADTTSTSKNFSVGAGKGTGGTQGISVFNTVNI